MTKKKELTADELTLVRVAKEYAGDEDKSRALFELWRWPNGVICPHCKNDGKEKPNSKLEAQRKSKNGVRDGVYFCGACRKQFSVTVGTIFEDSHLPLSTWLMAVFIFASSKKSVSAHQLHRMLGVAYQTAWYMAHRLRHAMSPDLPLGRKLSGTVEADEVYIGPRSDVQHSKSSKSAVVALVERGGEARTRVVSNITQKNARQFIGECVSKDAILNTDEHAAYRGKFKDYKRHDIVTHKNFEYSRTNPDGTKSGVNNCESFFSLFRRSITGSWHHISKEHLGRYASELEFKWNSRGITDGERAKKIIQSGEGKRLSYKPLIGVKPDETK